MTVLLNKFECLGGPLKTYGLSILNNIHGHLTKNNHQTGYRLTINKLSGILGAESLKNSTIPIVTEGLLHDLSQIIIQSVRCIFQGSYQLITTGTIACYKEKLSLIKAHTLSILQTMEIFYRIARGQYHFIKNIIEESTSKEIFRFFANKSGSDVVFTQQQVEQISNWSKTLAIKYPEKFKTELAIPCVYASPSNTREGYLSINPYSENALFEFRVSFVTKETKETILNRCKKLQIAPPLFLDDNKKEWKISFDNFPKMFSFMHVWIGYLSIYSDFYPGNFNHKRYLFLEFLNSITPKIFTMEEKDLGSPLEREFDFLIKLLEGELEKPIERFLGSYYSCFFNSYQPYRVSSFTNERNLKISSISRAWIRLHLKFLESRGKGMNSTWLPWVVKDPSRTDSVFFIPPDKINEVISLYKLFEQPPPLFLFDEEHKGRCIEEKDFPEWNCILMKIWIRCYDLSAYRNGLNLFKDEFRNQISIEHLGKLKEWAKDHDAPKHFVEILFRMFFTMKSSHKATEYISKEQISWLKELTELYADCALRAKYTHKRSFVTPVLYHKLEKSDRKDFNDTNNFPTISFVSAYRKEQCCKSFKVCGADEGPIFLLDDQYKNGLNLATVKLPQLSSAGIELIQGYDFGSVFSRFSSCRSTSVKSVEKWKELSKLMNVAIEHQEKATSKKLILELFFEKINFADNFKQIKNTNLNENDLDLSDLFLRQVNGFSGDALSLFGLLVREFKGRIYYLMKNEKNNKNLILYNQIFSSFSKINKLSLLFFLIKDKKTNIIAAQKVIILPRTLIVKIINFIIKIELTQSFYLSERD